MFLDPRYKMKLDTNQISLKTSVINEYKNFECKDIEICEEQINYHVINILDNLLNAGY